MRKDITAMVKVIDELGQSSGDADIVAEMIKAGYPPSEINQQAIRFYQANVNARDNPAFFKELNQITGERPTEKTAVAVLTPSEELAKENESVEAMLSYIFGMHA